MNGHSYKAAIFRGPGSVDVVDLPYPACGDEDIIVRNVLTGVCGSDLAAYAHGGDDLMIWRDHEFGHESISEVVEIGKNVTGLELGDHVFPNQGQALRDMMRMATVGGFSEFIRIPQCELGYSVIKIDKAIPIKAAVLFEPFLVGTRGALNLNPGPNKTAIVFGAGIIGMATAIMLHWYGCPKVMIVDICDFRLAKAEQFGLITCNSAEEDLEARALAEFGSYNDFFGERCAADLYVDAIGLKIAIDNFTRLAKRNAQLAVMGVHHEPVEFNLVDVCYRNWHINGCGDAPMEIAMVDILAMMQSQRYDLPSLITHVFSVDQITEALTLGRDATQAQKICIAF